MLNVPMYHGWRFFSHSGTCWTIGTRAASGGASRSAAGRRKTPVVWYESVPSLLLTPPRRRRRRRAARAPRRRRRRRTRASRCARAEIRADERARRGDRRGADEQVERAGSPRQALAGAPRAWRSVERRARVGTALTRPTASAAAAEGVDAAQLSSVNARRAGAPRVSPFRAMPGEIPPTGYVSEAVRLPLSAEILAARAAARLSRLTGRGGGTTVPGKLLSKLDPTALDRLARPAPAGLGARLRDEREDDDGRDGGRDPAPPLLARAQRARARISCRASSPRSLAAPGRRARALRGRRGARFPRSRARVQPARGLPRQPVPRPARPLRRARARRRALARRRRGAARRDDAGRERRRPSGRRARARAAGRASSSASTIRGTRDRRSSTRPTRSTASSCGTPYEYAAAYVGHLGDYRCPACGHARPALDVVARDIELEGLEHASFSLETPEGTRRVQPARARPLQRLQRCCRGGARARARHGARRHRGRPRAFRRGVRSLRAHRDRRPARAPAPDQESGGRERGGSHARRGPAARDSP